MQELGRVMGVLLAQLAQQLCLQGLMVMKAQLAERSWRGNDEELLDLP